MIDAKKRDGLQAKMARLRLMLDKEVERLQNECKHEDVIQVPYQSSREPHRVCAICGMQENGWHNQYISKLHPTREMGFEAAMRVRDKLRRFVTIENRF